MRRTHKASCTLTLAIGMVIASAMPALADGSESGTLSGCPSGKTPTLHATAKGEMHTKGPGDSSYRYEGTFASYTTRDNGGTGGYWRVYSTGANSDVDGVNTYGYCIY